MANAQPDITENLKTIKGAFIYIYGLPGTGKSSSVDFLYPDCYRKLKNNEKWDSYYPLRPGHQVVLLDEVDSYEDLEIAFGGVAGIKEKCDIYCFPVRQNYGSRQMMINPGKMIFLSNFTPSQVFSGTNKYGRRLQNLEMIVKAFYRRFLVIHISQWLEMNNLIFNKETQRIERKKEIPDTVINQLTPKTDNEYEQEREKNEQEDEEKKEDDFVWY